MVLIFIIPYVMLTNLAIISTRQTYEVLLVLSPHGTDTALAFEKFYLNINA